MTDFSLYTFRCSGLKNLMTDSRNKELSREEYAEILGGNTELAKSLKITSAGVAKILESKSYAEYSLSETTKSYLRELWIEAVYGRKKVITSKYMEKGTIVESDSLDIVQEALGKTYFKNQERFENEFIGGTPDVVSPDLVDIKSCWDIWTFAEKDKKTALSDYYYQLLGYMWLMGRTDADLIYTLANTPEHIVTDEMYRMSFKNPEIGQNDEADAEIKKNYVFDDIPVSQRVKVYTFQIDEVKIEKLKTRILLAREFMKDMSL